jgi:signal transduction histidine kinase
MNYVTNALKFSRDDKAVDVSLGMVDGLARVAVHDEGVGIPLTEQERVWERFHQVEGTRASTGSQIGMGLGLYISKTIVERHQGQVGVESAPGQGSTFWFTLPLAPAHATDALPTSSPIPQPSER